MAKVSNPVEVKIRMKKVKNQYHIGNCDMDISLLDTVIRFIPPKDDERDGVLIINNVKYVEPFEDEPTES